MGKREKAPVVLEMREGEAIDGTRRRILDVALRLFYERGFKGTSVSAIADEVGISAPSLYWHFASKQELCFAALREELGGFVDVLEHASRADTSAERLGGFVRSYVLQKLGQMERLSSPGAAMGYQELRNALKPDRREEIDLLQREVIRLVRGILEDGRARGDFTFGDLSATSFAVITLCEYVFSWVQPGRGLTPPEVAREYQSLALAMVHGQT